MMLIAILVLFVLTLSIRWCLRHWPSPDDVVSPAWRLQQQRREMCTGVDQSSVNWSLMQQLGRERGVI